MSEQTPSDRIDERFEILESKALYQDRTIEELNEVVTQQQNQIDLLGLELKQLRTLLENPERGIDGGDEPPPPHY